MTARSLASSDPSSFAGYVVPSRRATEIFVAPLMTCALVTMAPSDRTMNPEPSPAAARWPERPPKNCSNTSAATRSITSVCTVTTDGATRATASVIAVRRDEEIPSVRCEEGTACADEADGVPSQATSAPAISAANPILIRMSSVLAAASTDR